MEQKNRGRKQKQVDFTKYKTTTETKQVNIKSIDILSLPLNVLPKSNLYLDKENKNPVVSKANSNIFDCCIYDTVKCFLYDDKDKLRNNVDEVDLIIKKTTDIACWWCCHNFETLPVSVPIRIINKDIKYYKTHGCFCSFECCLAYMYKENIRDKSLFYSMAKQITGKQLSELALIKRAPDVRILKMFGGPVSIEDYRKSFIDNTEYNVYHYPCSPINYKVEMKKNDKIYNERLSKKRESASVSQVNLALSIKGTASATEKPAPVKKSLRNKLKILNVA